MNNLTRQFGEISLERPDRPSLEKSDHQGHLKDQLIHRMSKELTRLHNVKNQQQILIGQLQRHITTLEKELKQNSVPRTASEKIPFWVR